MKAAVMDRNGPLLSASLLHACLSSPSLLGHWFLLLFQDLIKKVNVL